jgi:DNA-directed RNA polymerase specialized sigma24 family protein
MYSQGFTHAEIAEITGRPRPTVIWKYNNALKKLKKISGGDNVD